MTDSQATRDFVSLLPLTLTLEDYAGTEVVGDGAVGLCGAIAAKRLGAEQIILMGRRPDRLLLGKAFGATNIVTERGEEVVEKVHQLTGCYGVHSVLECIGTDLSMQTALNIARPGGAIGRVGMPHDVTFVWVV